MRLCEDTGKGHSPFDNTLVWCKAYPITQQYEAICNSQCLGQIHVKLARQMFLRYFTAFALAPWQSYDILG